MQEKIQKKSSRTLFSCSRNFPVEKKYPRLFLCLYLDSVLQKVIIVALLSFPPSNAFGFFHGSPENPKHYYRAVFVYGTNAIPVLRYTLRLTPDTA
jgi:hypothetical protein